MEFLTGVNAILSVHSHTKNLWQRIKVFKSHGSLTIYNETPDTLYLAIGLHSSDKPWHIAGWMKINPGGQYGQIVPWVEPPWNTFLIYARTADGRTPQLYQGTSTAISMHIAVPLNNIVSDESDFVITYQYEEDENSAGYRHPVLNSSRCRNVDSMIDVYPHVAYVDNREDEHSIYRLQNSRF